MKLTNGELPVNVTETKIPKIRPLGPYATTYKQVMEDLLNTIDEEDMKEWLMASIEFLGKTRGYNLTNKTPQQYIKILDEHTDSKKD